MVFFYNRKIIHYKKYGNRIEEFEIMVNNVKRHYNGIQIEKRAVMPRFINWKRLNDLISSRLKLFLKKLIEK